MWLFYVAATTRKYNGRHDLFNLRSVWTHIEDNTKPVTERTCLSTIPGSRPFYFLVINTHQHVDSCSSLYLLGYLEFDVHIWIVDGNENIYIDTYLITVCNAFALMINDINVDFVDISFTSIKAKLKICIWNTSYPRQGCSGGIPALYGYADDVGQIACHPRRSFISERVLKRKRN